MSRHGRRRRTNKSEAATPRRLQKAREEGQVPVSRELTGLAGLAALTLALVMAGPGLWHDLTLRLSIFLARCPRSRARREPVFRVAGLAWLHAAAPFVLAALLAGVAVVLVQTRFLLSAKALRVDFSRVSPQAGLKRLLGADSLVEAAKSLTKIAVLAATAWRVLQADLPACCWHRSASRASCSSVAPRRCCT